MEKKHYQTRLLEKSLKYGYDPTRKLVTGKICLRPTEQAALFQTVCQSATFMYVHKVLTTIIEFTPITIYKEPQRNHRLGMFELSRESYSSYNPIMLH